MPFDIDTVEAILNDNTKTGKVRRALWAPGVYIFRDTDGVVKKFVPTEFVKVVDYDSVRWSDRLATDWEEVP